jgi:cyclopropane fatty-acyl-phospholipid synthase-like methyltransferase
MMKDGSYMATADKSKMCVMRTPQGSLPVRERSSLPSWNTSYDNADNPLWRLLVYEPVHSGREFINIGGIRVLDAIASRLAPQSSPRLLEIGSGLGANCIYLSSTYGYDITGIDANPHQVSKARARLTGNPHLQLHFVENDVLTWRPDRQYDCVYTLDTLMLIPESSTILRKAYDCLKDKGLLALTEMMAGPLLTEEFRKYAYQEDGIHLLSLDEYSAMLADVGFAILDVTDLTQLAGDTFQLIHQTACHRCNDVVEASNLKAYDNWVTLSRTYRDGFRARQYEYKMLFATR